MPKIEVNITDDQMADIRQDVKEDWERQWSHDKMMDFIKSTTTISAVEYLRQYGIYDRYQLIQDKPVKELSDHERFICALYWMMYEAFGRR